jgi:hypothetical protein
MQKLKENEMKVIGVNTKVLIADGSWEQIKDILNKYIVVPNKLLYTNYGFTNNDVNTVYVVE